MSILGDGGLQDNTGNMKKITLDEAIYILNGLVNGNVTRGEANSWGASVLTGLYNNIIVADPLDAKSDIDSIATICCQYDGMESEFNYIYDKDDLMSWIKDDGLEKYI